MSLVLTALRLIHISAGVFWAGTAIALAAFIMPAVKAAGPAGGEFMQKLIQHTRLSFFMNLSSLLTSLAGIALYWIISGGLSLNWLTTGHGLGITLGSIAGLLEYFSGLLIIAPTAKRMEALGVALQAAGGSPTSAQLAEMGTLERKLGSSQVRGAVFLAIAVIGMAIARYL